MPARNNDQPLREQVMAAVAAERERIEAISAWPREHGMRTPYPVWRTVSSGPRVEGSDHITIYDEGGHDELQAAHIAGWDPTRAMAVVQLSESLLGETHVPHKRSPSVCRECMTTLPCPAVLMLADIWLPPGQEDAWPPEKRAGRAEPLAAPGRGPGRELARNRGVTDMRVTFYEPESGCTPEAVADVLSLSGEQLPPDQVSRWTRLELVMAYDWAIREHLHAAGNPVRRRDRPSFLRPVDQECTRSCGLLGEDGPS